jgi:hypothetical protein
MALLLGRIFLGWKFLAICFMEINLISVTKTKRLQLLTELIAVYCDNRTLTRLSKMYEQNTGCSDLKDEPVFFW